MLPAVRQSAHASIGGTSGPNIACTFGSPVLQGSRLVAFGDYGDTFHAGCVMSDTVNGTGRWTQLNTATAPDAPLSASQWELLNSNPGTCTITFAFPVNEQFNALIIYEITGSDYSLPSASVAALAANGTTMSTTYTSPSLTPAYDGCLLIGGCSNGHDSTGPASVNAPFAIREVTTVGQANATADGVQATAAPVQVVFTYAVAEFGTVHLMAVPPLSAGMPMRRALAAQLR